MKIGAWLALTGICALAAACSGTTVLGTGVGTSGGSGGAGPGIGGSGSSIGGKGGSGGAIDYAPCAGKACGDICTTCPPGDTPCINIGMYCAADGSCGLNGPACSRPGAECGTDKPCISPKYCLTCPNGGASCAQSYCDAGKCVTSFPACNAECQKDADCAASVAPCEPCSDGSKSCPTVTCVAGKCQGSVPGCPGYDPCAGRSCGSKCSACDPSDPICQAADLPFTYCDVNGKCVPTPIGPYFPDCSGGAACKTKDDCGAPPPECLPCDFGGCAALDCFANQCMFSCPVPATPQCKVSSDCITDLICKLCPDTSCAVTECIAGGCQQVCPG